jgi:hypothetical protein
MHSQALPATSDFPRSRVVLPAAVDDRDESGLPQTARSMGRCRRPGSHAVRLPQGRSRPPPGCDRQVLRLPCRDAVAGCWPRIFINEILQRRLRLRGAYKTYVWGDPPQAILARLEPNDHPGSPAHSAHGSVAVVVGCSMRACWVYVYIIEDLNLIVPPRYYIRIINFRVTTRLQSK